MIQTGKRESEQQISLSSLGHAPIRLQQSFTSDALTNRWSTIYGEVGLVSLILRICHSTDEEDHVKCFDIS